MSLMAQYNAAVKPKYDEEFAAWKTAADAAKEGRPGAP